MNVKLSFKVPHSVIITAGTASFILKELNVISFDNHIILFADTTSNRAHITRLDEILQCLFWIQNFTLPQEFRGFFVRSIHCHELSVFNSHP